MMENILAKSSNIIAKIINIATPLAENLIYAAIIMIIGLWVGKRLIKRIIKLMVERNIDETFTSFLKNILNTLLFIVVALSALHKLGVQTASIIALLAAMSLAIGMALRSSLANFASGLLLVFFRPFKVGDSITISNHVGKVTDISILFTTIVTANNQIVTVPNNNFMQSAFVSSHKLS